jgi:hypothetical protein
MRKVPSYGLGALNRSHPPKMTMTRLYPGSHCWWVFERLRILPLLVDSLFEIFLSSLYWFQLNFNNTSFPQSVQLRSFLPFLITG